MFKQYLNTKKYFLKNEFVRKCIKKNYILIDFHEIQVIIKVNQTQYIGDCNEINLP